MPNPNACNFKLKLKIPCSMGDGVGGALFADGGRPWPLARPLIRARMTVCRLPATSPTHHQEGFLTGKLNMR